MTPLGPLSLALACHGVFLSDRTQRSERSSGIRPVLFGFRAFLTLGAAVPPHLRDVSCQEGRRGPGKTPWEVAGKPLTPPGVPLGDRLWAAPAEGPHFGLSVVSPLLP